MKEHLDIQKKAQAPYRNSMIWNRKLLWWCKWISITYVILYVFVLVPLSVEVPKSTSGTYDNAVNFLTKAVEGQGEIFYSFLDAFYLNMSEKKDLLPESSFWQDYCQSFLYVFVSADGKIGINGLGDALAGLFAPLVFFWVIAAFFVQSDQADIQQLEFARQQKKMNQQTTDALINEKLVWFRHIVSKRNWLYCSFERYDDALSSRSLEIFSFKNINAIVAPDLIIWFDGFRSLLNSEAKKVSSFYIEKDTFSVNSNIEGYNDVIRILTDIKELQEGASEICLVGLEYYYVNFMLVGLTNIRDNIDKMIQKPLCPVR